MYTEFYCAAPREREGEDDDMEEDEEEEEKERMSTTPNDAGEIFDLNVRGDLAALARSNFSLASENSSCKMRVSRVQ